MEYLKFLTQNKDFEFGFLVLGFSSHVLGLFGIFLMIWLGLKLRRIEYWLNFTQILCRFSGKAIHIKEAPASKRCRFKGNAADHGLNDTVEEEEAEDDKNEDRDEDEGEDKWCKVNEEFRVSSLRKLIKFERKRAKKARNELDKERTAAASAAMEAMAVILRLQREKNSVEMEANQFRRMAEHRLDYDNQMINYLQWIVTKHESERNLLQDELRLCKEKFKLLTNENDEVN